MGLRAWFPVMCVGIAVPTVLWVLGAKTAPVHEAARSQDVRDSPLVASSPRILLLAEEAVPPKPVTPAAAEAGPPLRLVGVVESGKHSLALIATAAGPAQVFRVGAVVHGDTVVKSVSVHEVRLGRRDGPASTVLVLKALTSGATRPIISAASQRQPAIDDAEDSSPIVPPHTDMPTPRASESGTPGSHWSELRAKSATQ